MRIVCQQTILVKYHTLFFMKFKKDVDKLSSAAVVIDALRVNCFSSVSLLVCSVVLRPSQQLWSCRGSQVIEQHFFLGKLATGLTSTLCIYVRLQVRGSGWGGGGLVFTIH